MIEPMYYVYPLVVLIVLEEIVHVYNFGHVAVVQKSW